MFEIETEYLGICEANDFNLGLPIYEIHYVTARIQGLGRMTRDHRANLLTEEDLRDQVGYIKVQRVDVDHWIEHLCPFKWAGSKGHRAYADRSDTEKFYMGIMRYHRHGYVVYPGEEQALKEIAELEESYRKEMVEHLEYYRDYIFVDYIQVGNGCEGMGIGHALYAAAAKVCAKYFNQPLHASSLQSAKAVASWKRMVKIGDLPVVEGKNSYALSYCAA